jgi:uridine kinase
MKIDEIVNEIKELKAKKPFLIGIEGFGGAGKSTLSHKLKDVLGGEAYIIQTDDFVIKEKLTLASPDMECYDLERLEAEVLRPAQNNQAIVYRRLNWDTFELGEPIRIPPVEYLIIEA